MAVQMNVDARRRVLFVIPTLTGGGAERVVVTLLNNLDPSRFRLTLAVVDTRRAVFRAEVPENVELLDLVCRRVRYALPKIALLIWRRRPDVVFSTLGHLNLALATIRPLLPDHVRYIGRETNAVSEGLRTYYLSSVWRWAYRRFYRRFDIVVCQSQAMQDELVKNFNFPATKSAVIHNPVDIARIRRLAAEALPKEIAYAAGDRAEPLIHLVAAGRLDPQKGFDLLIESVALCADPRLCLTILGEGPLRTSLEGLAEKLGVAGQVCFAGFQRNPYPFFLGADAFVLSSRYEGLPNAMLEALACGTPVIATPAPGGTNEILNGLEGCIVAEAISARALASAIKQWLKSGRRRVSGNAVSRFSLANIIGRYEEILDSA